MTPALSTPDFLFVVCLFVCLFVFPQLEKVGSGGRSFSLFTKDPEQAKEEKRGRLDSNIEEVHVRRSFGEGEGVGWD